MKNHSNYCLLKAWRENQRKKKHCLDCAAPVKDGQGRCKKHRKSHSKVERARREKKKKLGICRSCKKKSRKGGVYCFSCTSKVNDSSKKSTAKMRDIVIEAYGGTCVCCGVKERSFLSIDHIYGGGRKHIKKLGGGGTTFYRWLRKKKYPSGFQILCHNCNYSKYILGVCAHSLIKNKVINKEQK
jgi:hypothetical protein